MEIEKIEYSDYNVTYHINRCDIGKNTITLSATDEDNFLILIHNINGDYLVNSSFSFNTALDLYSSTIQTLEEIITL